MQAKHEKYRFVNGTAYHLETPDAVVKWLETSRQNGQRIRIFYGDVETGRDWMEEYDTIGRVGRSTGDVKIPILIKSERSHGGGAILDHCIVRITTKNSKGEIVDVYRHPNYSLPYLKIVEYPGAPDGYEFAVWDKDENKEIARFTTYDKAKRYIDFLEGNRNSK
jgi:hypothetical protein